MPRLLAVGALGGVAKTLATPAPAPASAAATPPPPPFAVFAGRTGIPWRAAFRRRVVAISLRLEIVRLFVCATIAGALFRRGGMPVFVAWLVPLAVIPMAALAVAGTIPLAVPATAPAAAAASAAPALFVGWCPCSHRLGRAFLGDSRFAAFLGYFVLYFFVLEWHFRRGTSSAREAVFCCAPSDARRHLVSWQVTRIYGGPIPPARPACY
jgi:hypothetical protein